VAWRVETVAVVDSTNDRARDRVLAAWARGERPDGLVIAADRQAAGRGQHGRVWESPPGGLYLSAVVEHVPADLRDKLSLLAGLAAAAGIQQATGVRAGLWWPNDVMCGEKKVGGILCEAAAMGGGGAGAGGEWAGIVGIGINVNTPLDALPPHLRGRATSLAAIAGRPQDVAAVRAAVLAALADTLAHAAHAGAAAVIHLCRQRDTLNGCAVTVSTGDAVVAGAAAGLGDGGELRVRTAGGDRLIAHGTILTVDGRALRG
jgi:BirA family biotin operon repressor/biotin-[acetyl-CoA-carboxylase] ligase